MNAVEREQLIDQYLKTLAAVRRAKERAGVRGTDRDMIDRDLLAGMERDLLWTIEYLESGHVPDVRRGAYKWVVPVDPCELRRMVKIRSDEGADWVSRDAELDQLLSVLTPREREAFILVRGNNCTYREVARYMGVRSVGTVANMVRRAERKVRKSSVRRFVVHQTQ